MDGSWDGFQWIEADDNTGNTIIYLRKNKKKQALLIAVNFSPIHRAGYCMGVPTAGTYEVMFNSDDPKYGGQGRGNSTPIKTVANPCHGFEHSLFVDLPPHSGVILRCIRKNPVRKAKTTDKKAKSARKTKAKDGAK